MKRLPLIFLLFVVPAMALHAAKPEIPAVALAKEAQIDAAYKEIRWDELVPRDWDPAKPFRNLKLDRLDDADPRVMEVLELMKKEWDNAPIDPSLEGRKVRIAGFVVPIEERGRAVSEFLLVPYFGACIHVPPPPANQIIHVIAAKPIKNLQVMSAVWVAGEIKGARHSVPTGMGMGSSGYQIRGALVAAYEEPVIMSVKPGR